MSPVERPVIIKVILSMFLVRNWYLYSIQTMRKIENHIIRVKLIKHNSKVQKAIINNHIYETISKRISCYLYA